MSLRTWKPIFILAGFGLLLLTGAIPAAAQYWPDGCLYRRAITIDHTKVPNTDQANFPVLISATYSYLATTANGGNVTNTNGYDILFTSDADGLNPIPFERETYNPSTGAINYWVQVPTVSHTTDTVIYMFYGNSSISSASRTRLPCGTAIILGFGTQARVLGTFKIPLRTTTRLFQLH